MWRRAMLYLGLGPDDEYDDYDAGRRPPTPRPPRPAGSQRAPGEPAVTARAGARAVEPSRVAGARCARIDAAAVDPSAGIGRRPGRAGRGTAVVRPLQPWRRPSRTSSSPTSFNQAQEVADKFKGNQPVIVNLQGVDRDLSRRLIDFASGLCYGLGGQMEKVANQVYLLTPTNVEVSAEERRRLQERGYHEG